MIQLNNSFIGRLLGFPQGLTPKIPPVSTAPPPARRGIYLLPALFTLGNMAMGFFSLTLSLRHQFGLAATVILIGQVFDMFDGAIARMTRTTSRFGIELDSLADWMTFCIAPSFLMYEMVLKDNRSWGFPIALLFVVCGALRLARFNLKAQMGEGATNHFTGLPTPAAGGLLAIFALLYDVLELGKPIRSLRVVMDQLPVFYEAVPAVMLLLSLLMVSDVRYAKFRTQNLLRPRSMRALVLTVLALLMIWVYPQNTIFILYVSYIVWGLVDYFLGRSLRRHPTPLETEKHVDHYGK